MKLDILTPEKKVFEGEVESVNIPTPLGFITVLSNHASLVSSISQGKIRIKTKEGENSFLTTGGLIEVSNSKAVLLLRKYED